MENKKRKIIGRTTFGIALIALSIKNYYKNKKHIDKKEILSTTIIDEEELMAEKK